MLITSKYALLPPEPLLALLRGSLIGDGPPWGGGPRPLSGNAWRVQLARR